MTQEDKELLLKDLCTRLPYNVRGEVSACKNCIIYPHDIEDFERCERNIKPYLRPMSSMTVEEEEKFNEFIVIVDDIWKGDLKNGFPKQSNIMSDGIDYLNSIHIDYRGLIEKGLALVAPEGMYNN